MPWTLLPLWIVLLTDAKLYGQSLLHIYGRGPWSSPLCGASKIICCFNRFRRYNYNVYLTQCELALSTYPEAYARALQSRYELCPLYVITEHQDTFWLIHFTYCYIVFNTHSLGVQAYRRGRNRRMYNHLLPYGGYLQAGGAACIVQSSATAGWVWPSIYGQPVILSCRGVCRLQTWTLQTRWVFWQEPKSKVHVVSKTHKLGTSAITVS